MEIAYEAKKKDRYPSALYGWVNVGLSSLCLSHDFHDFLNPFKFRGSANRQYTNIQHHWLGYAIEVQL